ncbi:MAG TPA: ATP-dependent DNA ligase [Steroidobacteraceae bacterium]|jgi:DNA ligase-1|nr:ATP-dependent DNA ligase [Steroidobacteraceae bacterium]
MTLIATLVDTSHRVSATPGRLAKIEELAGLLRTLQPDEIEIAALYLSGEMPQGRIGIGYATLQAAATGEAAPVATLAISEVDRQLAALAATRGGGSARRRDGLLRELFERATAAEQQFLLRLFVGELRQGALAGIMVDAIAAAAGVPTALVRRGAMYSGNLGAVARAALLEGAAGLARFQLELFSPVSPMLAQTAADVAEALQELGGEAAFEWKMDGARIQAHKRDDEIRLYTRGLNEVTGAVPEIVDLVRTFPARALILDGETIAVDAAGRPHPFQITMRRFGRRRNVAAMRAGLPVQAFFFDCLRIEAETIADRPTSERYRALAAAVPDPVRIPRLVTSSEEAARAFYEGALAAGHEGLMAKSLRAPYEAGNRGASWLKIKRTHTLDLVVLAAEWGHGRRRGKLSNLHLGARDPATGEYIMLGKTFKGLTDAMLEWQTRQLLARETGRDPWTVYVRPELVVEIAFSDLQASTRYPGGLALRLARVKRYRDDKSAEDADNMESVRRIYAASAGTQGGAR